MFASPDKARIISETAQERTEFVEAFKMLATDASKGADAVVRKLIEGVPNATNREPTPEH